MHCFQWYIEKYESENLQQREELLLEKGLHDFPVHPEAEPALGLAEVDRPGSLVELDA